MANITFYTKKLKKIKFVLDAELKKGDKKNSMKVNRLEIALSRCSREVKARKRALYEKRRKIPRKSMKGRLPRGRRKMFAKKFKRR